MKIEKNNRIISRTQSLFLLLLASASSKWKAVISSLQVQFNRFASHSGARGIVLHDNQKQENGERRNEKVRELERHKPFVAFALTISGQNVGCSCESK